MRGDKRERERRWSTAAFGVTEDREEGKEPRGVGTDLFHCYFQDCGQKNEERKEKAKGLYEFTLFSASHAQTKVKSIVHKTLLGGRTQPDWVRLLTVVAK